MIERKKFMPSKSRLFSEIITQSKQILIKLCCFLNFLFIFEFRANASIHPMPLVIQARQIRTAQYHPIKMYRVFRTAKDGTAIPIPFQIDEKDRYGDYILPFGPLPNNHHSNGIFDFRDELSIMGSDVGIATIPKKWPFKKPSVLYEVLFENKSTGKIGAVYIGAYFSAPPPLSKKSYVEFDIARSTISTSRYKYKFNPDNYLVIDRVDIKQKSNLLHLIDSSTLFLRADLKYFFTLSINQNSIESDLEAYKVGPIRCIARVNFNYTILKLNFDLGMYTEVSFFANAIELPAMIDNPLDGYKILNDGSQFYYGFSLVENPANISIDTNMPDSNQSTLLNFLRGKEKVKNQYWFTASSPHYMIHVEMSPSDQMKKTGTVPMFYKEATSAKELKKRALKSAAPLGKSPVNLAISLDLTSLTEGLHKIAIRLYVENNNDKKTIETFKSQHDWRYSAKRLPSASFR